MNLNKYYDENNLNKKVSDGKHRESIGGMWDEIGILQFNHLKEHGLTPPMNVIDIGCGCLRAGVHIVEFLDSGNYFGIDISESLLEAGYNKELSPELRKKLPRKNLRRDDGFNTEQFGVKFDRAIAQSVFTHLPLNHMKLCINRLSPLMTKGSLFHFTIFLANSLEEWKGEIEIPTLNRPSFPDRDPFHYTQDDINYAIAKSPWRIAFIGGWHHPRGQKMVILERT